MRTADRTTHLMTSVAKHAGLATFVREYGWLVGIGWLFVVVLWEARKPRDAERRQVKAMMQLQVATVDVLRQGVGASLCCRRPTAPPGVKAAASRIAIQILEPDLAVAVRRTARVPRFGWLA